MVECLRMYMIDIFDLLVVHKQPYIIFTILHLFPSNLNLSTYPILLVSVQFKDGYIIVLGQRPESSQGFTCMDDHLNNYGN